MAADKPLVTIGIPFHNAADTLLDAVRSIFAQSYTNWELILAIDGSTDGSDELARRIRDERVRLIGGEKRRFLSYRLNQITQEARGKFIARMDADDFSAPERIAKQLRFLQAHSELDACGTGMFNMDERLQLLGRRIQPAAHEEICANPLRGLGLAHATLFAKAEWFREHPYNETCLSSQDWDLWLRTYQTSRFGNLPDLLYLYRATGTLSWQRYTRAKRTVARAVLTSNPTAAPLSARMYHAGRQYAEMVGFLGLAVLSGGVSRCKMSGRQGDPVTREHVELFNAVKKQVQRTVLPLGGCTC